MIDPREHNSADAIHRFEHDAMACTFGLYIAGADASYARQTAQAVFGELERIENLLSRFVPHSDIARLNDLEPGESIRVSAETIECLQLAARVQADTGGAFDVAFRGRSAGADAVPLAFDPAGHTIGVCVAGVTLDLGGIGKGYALDRMADVLREWGISAALLHSGHSTVYALGHPPGANHWSVGLRHPENQDETWATAKLHDRALAGSGQRLHGRHIINPRSGAPCEEATAAWSLAPTAALGDALSTAFMVLALFEIEALCERVADITAILGPDAQHEPICFPRDHNPLS